MTQSRPDNHGLSVFQNVLNDHCVASGPRIALFAFLLSLPIVGEAFAKPSSVLSTKDAASVGAFGSIDENQPLVDHHMIIAHDAETTYFFLKTPFRTHSYSRLDERCMEEEGDYSDETTADDQPAAGGEPSEKEERSTARNRKRSTDPRPLFF
ncbi:MAG: hypothetical protein AAF224_06615 [Pseudomonadota bacterium]